MVEMEINSRCNLRCPYCPVSIDPPLHVPRLMHESVLDRLLAELERLGFAGRVSYHFYNEPLLHPDLRGVVAAVKSRLPEAQQVLYTNGELLDEARHRQLREAGVDLFVVTSHSGREFPPRENQVLLKPTDLQLTNRGGALDDIGPAPPLTLPCYAPSTVLVITATGDVVLCYEDYHRTQVMGNVMDGSLEDIWFSPRFSHLREALGQGDRAQTSICRACNNQAHTTPHHYTYIP